MISLGCGLRPTPRDLEYLIDVVELASPRIPVESVTGSLKLASDADITYATAGLGGATAEAITWRSSW